MTLSELIPEGFSRADAFVATIHPSAILRMDADDRAAGRVAQVDEEGLVRLNDAVGLVEVAVLHREPDGHRHRILRRLRDMLPVAVSRKADHLGMDVVHGQLVANEVTEVALDANYRFVDVVKRDSDSEMFVVVDPDDSVVLVSL